jgi:hypothetical protein
MFVGGFFAVISRTPSVWKIGPELGVRKKTPKISNERNVNSCSWEVFFAVFLKPVQLILGGFFADHPVYREYGTAFCETSALPLEYRNNYGAGSIVIMYLT